MVSVPYSCTTRIRLYFLHTVPPSILSSSAPVSKVINSSASLFCSVRGYPLPTISWLKDGVPVATDSTITITTQSATSVSPEYLQQLNTTFTGDVGVISVLQFSSLQRKDNGMYVCQATNSLNRTGSFNTTTSPITIKVLGKRSVQYCYHCSLSLQRCHQLLEYLQSATQLCQSTCHGVLLPLSVIVPFSATRSTSVLWTARAHSPSYQALASTLPLPL